MSGECWDCKRYTHSKVYRLQILQCSAELISKMYCRFECVLLPSRYACGESVFLNPQAELPGCSSTLQEAPAKRHSYYYIRPRRWRPCNAFNVWTCGCRKQTHLQKHYSPIASNSDIQQDSRRKPTVLRTLGFDTAFLRRVSEVKHHCSAQ